MISFKQTSILLLLCCLFSLQKVIFATDTCKDTPGHLVNDTGTISISRQNQTCGFIARDDATFFALQTDNLILKAGDTVEIISEPATNKTVLLSPPFGKGYLAIGLTEPQIKFFFSNVDKTTMEVEYMQPPSNPMIPLDGDIYNELHIKPIGLDSINLNFAKKYSKAVHLEIIDGPIELFAHDLIFLNNTAIPIKFQNDRAITVKTTPVYEPCAKEYVNAAGNETYDISGPDVKPGSGYLCAFRFTSSKLTSHYDVDFANFLDVSDTDDELIIDDGTSRLKIDKANAKTFAKRVVSFRNQLIVLYHSPRSDPSSQIPFKLTVKSKEFGGIVNKGVPLTLPPSGFVRFDLQPGSEEYASLAIKDNKLTGLNLTLIGVDGHKIRLPEGSYVPPTITSNLMGSPLAIELEVGNKPSIIEYRPTTGTCDGILFEPFGSISLEGFAGRNCSWLFGGNNSQLNVVDHSKLSGCLELHDIKHSNPIFNQCNINKVSVLPGFTVGSGWLKLAFRENGTRFVGSIHETVATISQTSSAFQTNITSIGYPVTYDWSSMKETLVIDGTNKSLSVLDADIRVGEKLLVNNIEFNSANIFAMGDIEITNKTNITINRSSSTSDFNIHRGFKVVTTKFQKIMVVDTKNKTNIVTPKNFTSLLLKISAAELNRISYNITFLPPPKDEVISVIDSRSLFGPTMDAGEKFHGSTTSNYLLISLRSPKPGTTIPGMSIDYKSIPCNKTEDHICDGSTRCVPADKLCKGKSYCVDKTDLSVRCSSGPAPNPKVIETGVGGMAVFILCVLMFALGSVAALYGPDFYKNLDSRFRSGHYTTFTSTE